MSKNNRVNDTKLSGSIAQDTGLNKRVRPIPACAFGPAKAGTIQCRYPIAFLQPFHQIEGKVADVAIGTVYKDHVRAAARDNGMNGPTLNLNKPAGRRIGGLCRRCTRCRTLNGCEGTTRRKGTEKQKTSGQCPKFHRVLTDKSR